MLEAPKLQNMTQTHLLDYRQLHYDAFIHDIVCIIVSNYNVKGRIILITSSVYFSG